MHTYICIPLYIYIYIHLYVCIHSFLACICACVCAYKMYTHRTLTTWRISENSLYICIHSAFITVQWFIFGGLLDLVAMEACGT